MTFIRTWLKRAALLLSLIAMIGLAYILSKRPSDDRDWVEALAHKASIEQSGDDYTIHNFKNWAYGPDAPLEQNWGEKTVNLEDLKEVWFFLGPFKNNPNIGHTYVSFLFETETGIDAVAVSIEARREKGETYDPLEGMLRNYELLYVWSTEKDVHTRTAVNIDHELQAYKLNLMPEQAKIIFTHFVARTNKLAHKPRFYSTLHSNCTIELAKAVNDAFPGTVPLRPPLIMTGQSPKWLHSKGHILPKDASFETVKAHAQIQPAVKASYTLPPSEFSAAWRHTIKTGHKETSEGL